MPYSEEQGKRLITIARNSIAGKKILPEDFTEERGVFVTIYSWPEKHLRGCIGFPEPVEKLGKAVMEAARSAAKSDPRFEPVFEDEEFIIEISVLTPPEEIRGIEDVRIGKDGLIIDFEGQRGLLLPQVFLEFEADAEKALEMTCQKAGLDKNCWRKDNCKAYRFQADIFAEIEPDGKVIKKNLLND